MLDFLKLHKQSPVFSSIETDIHCHLIPGVDDGSTSLDETVNCLREMAKMGFKKIFFTPHFQARYPNQEEDILKRFELLKEHLRKLGDNDLPEIGGIAGEYRFDNLYEKHPEDKPLTLPGKKLLCELSLHTSEYSPIEVFKQFLDAGYSLILAHPERYPYLNIHSKLISDILNMGVKIQVNILSLQGFYGVGAMEKGYDYMRNGIVDYIATDTHNMRYVNALAGIEHNKRLRKIIDNTTFLNNQL